MNATFSMLDLDLGESLTLLRETVQRFAADEIKPRAATIDRDNEFPMDLWLKMGDLGRDHPSLAKDPSGTRYRGQ